MSKGSSVSRGNRSQHSAISSVSIAGNKRGSWGSKAGTEVAVHKFYLAGSRRRVEVAALFVVPYIEILTNNWSELSFNDLIIVIVLA